MCLPLTALAGRRTASCLLKAPSSSASLPQYYLQRGKATNHHGLDSQWHGGPTTPDASESLQVMLSGSPSLPRKKGGPPASSPVRSPGSKLGIVLRHTDTLSVQDMPAFIWRTEACKNAMWSFPEWYLLLERSSAVGHTSY